VVVGMVVELDEVFIGSGRSCNQTLLKWWSMVAEVVAKLKIICG
jgi:hypothetical protein